MNVLIAVLSLLVTVQYVVIAVYVVPRLGRLPQERTRLIRLATVAAVAFFAGCAATHATIAAHALSESSFVAGAHGWLHLFPHLAQLAGGIVFLWVVHTRLDVILRTKEEALVEAENLELQQQLEHSTRLESIGQLAGGVAHDFNNLLAVILNYARFVQDDLPVGDRRKEDVSEIQQAAERARDLTDQLLMFSRQERQQIEVVDVARGLAAAENLLGRTIGAHIELVARVQPDLLRVRLGAGKLEQILVNLAVNARDAMLDGGRLVIAAENARNANGSGSVVRLTVRDDGMGMTPEVTSRVFDPFFTTKPTGQGTGLGLATVYGIVTRAGGEVRIESREGVGTAVIIDLPATTDLPDAEQAAAALPSSGDGLRVLVVEDEPAVRALTVRTLRGQGYEVIEAGDGLEGLDRCREAGGTLDLLLTDVVMPGMSGVELAARARRHTPGLAVVYVSGYAGGLLPAGARADEEGSLLAKPFSRETLLRYVEDALRRGGPPAGPEVQPAAAS